MSLYKILVAVDLFLESLRNKFFIGGDMEENKMNWVAWRKCLASKDLGGLGIGSIFALIRALLFKWIWRFLNRPTDLWAEVITSIYGSNGCIGDSVAGSSLSPWVGVLKTVNQLMAKGINLLEFCKRKVGRKEF